RARAIPDVHLPRRVERDSCRDAEVAGEGLRLLEGRYAIDSSVEATRDVHLSVGIERDPGRIHELREKGLHLALERDFVDGDRNLLTARSRERCVDRPVVAIESGIRHGMNV